MHLSWERAWRHNIRKLFAEIEGAGNDDITDLLSPGYGNLGGSGNGNIRNDNIFDVNKLGTKISDAVKTVSRGLQIQQGTASATTSSEQSEPEE